MVILVLGASGFIGRNLVRALLEKGHHLRAVSRNPQNAKKSLPGNIEVFRWDGSSVEGMVASLHGVDGLVNLAGENIAGGLWTKKKKARLTSSRVSTGRIISDAILRLDERPAFLVQGSATGYYGPVTAGETDESHGPGTGFLAELVQQWEASVSVLSESGLRLAYARTGIVMGPEGGMLQKLMLPFSFYSGTTLGNGRQHLSWIHIHDEVEALCHLIGNPESSGAYNLTSPQPVTMRDLVKRISEITGKPAFLKIPDVILKTAMGQMASETILSDQVILPSRLIREGFKFKFTSPADALIDLLRK
jgi:uncharacterized protein (TIGR01777 family)